MYLNKLYHYRKNGFLLTEVIFITILCWQYLKLKLFVSQDNMWKKTGYKTTQTSNDFFFENIIIYHRFSQENFPLNSITYRHTHICIYANYIINVIIMPKIHHLPDSKINLPHFSWLSKRKTSVWGETLHK